MPIPCPTLAGPARLPGHGEDLVRPGRAHIGLLIEPREPGLAQTSAKDSAPGIHSYVVYLDTKCPPLPGPAWLCSFPALSCHGLSVPKLAFPYPAWLCTVQHCSSRRPCPVLLTMLDPVRSCPALLNTDRPFVALPGPSRPRLVLTGAALFSLCLALSCPTLLGHGRPCTNLPSSALRCQLFYHGPPSLVLSYPAWPWDCLTLPFLPLSGAAAHARSCPALRDTLETWLLAPPWTFGRLVKGDDI